MDAYYLLYGIHTRDAYNMSTSLTLESFPLQRGTWRHVRWEPEPPAQVLCQAQPHSEQQCSRPLVPLLPLSPALSTAWWCHWEGLPHLQMANPGEEQSRIDHRDSWTRKQTTWRAECNKLTIKVMQYLASQVNTKPVRILHTSSITHFKGIMIQYCVVCTWYKRSDYG